MDSTAEADSVLMKALEINPDFESGLMFLGKNARAQDEEEIAAGYYERLIDVNKKHYEAYVELSGLLVEKDLHRARGILRECLKINPEYKPAIIALADTYLKTNPEIAEKYYKLADTIK